MENIKNINCVHVLWRMNSVDTTYSGKENSSWHDLVALIKPPQTVLGLFAKLLSSQFFFTPSCNSPLHNIQLTVQ